MIASLVQSRVSLDAGRLVLLLTCLAGLLAVGLLVSDNVWWVPVTIVSSAYGAVLLDRHLGGDETQSPWADIAITIAPPLAVSGVVYATLGVGIGPASYSLSTDLLWYGSGIVVAAAYHLENQRERLVRWAVVGLVLAPLLLAHLYRLLIQYSHISPGLYLGSQLFPTFVGYSMLPVAWTIVLSVPTYWLGRDDAQRPHSGRFQPETVLGGVILVGLLVGFVVFGRERIPPTSVDELVILLLYLVPAAVVLYRGRSLVLSRLRTA